jgi:Ca2+-binding RTX toxin-like protein
LCASVRVTGSSDTGLGTGIAAEIDARAIEMAQAIAAGGVAAFDLGQVTPQPGAVQLAAGTAADEAFVAGIRALASIAAQTVAIAGLAEPGTPAGPAAPATTTTRTGTAAYDFFDIATAQAVRIETQGGDDFIRLGDGNNTSPVAITAVVIGSTGREAIQGNGGRVLGRFEPGGGNDTVSGNFAAGSAITALMGDGDDFVRIDSGAHFIDGGAGNDNLTGGDGADTIIGGVGADTIFGEAITNWSSIPAAGGNDLLIGGTGNDSIYGAGGNDRIVGGADSDRVEGHGGNDTLWGGSGRDSLWGGDGDDLLLGGGDADYAEGGAGRDSVEGSDGDDMLFGNGDDDVLVGGAGLDSLYGGDGNDQLNGGNGSDYLDGGAGFDLLLGGDGNDTMFGLDGNDSIHGEAGNDVLYGGGGDDQLVDRSGSNEFWGGAGHDLIVAGGTANRLFGEGGNDTLIAGAGSDLLDGGEGADVLMDSPDGPATLIGGTGADIFIVRHAGTVVRDFGSEPGDVVHVYVDDWLPPTSGIERVVYMGGATPPSDAVLALHATSLRPAAGEVTAFRYAFVESGFSTTRAGNNPFTGSFLPSGQALQMAAVDANTRLGFRQAANEFERIANIRFVEVASVADADLAIGVHNMSVGGYATLGAQPGTNAIAQLMISTGVPGNQLLAGALNHSLMLHELGHIIGLKHPFEGSYRLSGNDTENGRFSLMSYGRGASDAGLMMFDIEATRFIYGARATATGDDVYRFDRTNSWFAALVDDGGNDTIDLAGNVHGAVLDLAGGAFSSLNLDSWGHSNMPRNLGITRGTTIENAIGTSQADQIAGNAAANRLDGGGGNDTLAGGAGADTLVGGGGTDIIDGGPGRDVAVFAGARSAYQITRAGGVLTVTGGGEGTDTLTGVERLQFADGALSAVARSLVLQTAGGDLFSWDATRGSAGFSYLLQLGGGASVAGVADFTGDGAADLLFRTGPGQYVRWDVGAGGSGFATLSSFGAFAPIAQADLRGGSGVDVLALSPNRDLVVFDVEANSSSYLLNMAPGFAVAGVGNIDGAGKADIVFQNQATGALFALTDAGWRDLLTLGGGWRLAGLADVVGGPADDFVFMNDTTRNVVFWDATAGGAGWRDFATIAPGWNIAGFHDLDGDARTDVLLQQPGGDAIYWTGAAWGSLGNVLANTTFLGAGELG